jgi:hypothetical protein
MPELQRTGAIRRAGFPHLDRPSVVLTRAYIAALITGFPSEIRSYRERPAAFQRVPLQKKFEMRPGWGALFSIQVIDDAGLVAAGSGPAENLNLAVLTRISFSLTPGYPVSPSEDTQSLNLRPSPPGPKRDPDLGGLSERTRSIASPQFPPLPSFTQPFLVIIRSADRSGFSRFPRRGRADCPIWQEVVDRIGARVSEKRARRFGLSLSLPAADDVMRSLNQQRPQVGGALLGDS